MMKDIQKTLDWYMGRLDSWVENEYDSMKGVFSYLSEALLVRKLAVSPNFKSGLDGLRSFLATEVLGIHRNKASKITYQYLQNYLAGVEQNKKYHFNFDVLPKTVDKQINKEAFLSESQILEESRKVKGDDYLQKEIEQCDEWIPYILLDEARQVLWTKVNKFYNVCTESFCEGCEKKKQVYYQFTQAAALFEIIYVEFVQSPIRDYIQKGNELLNKIQRRAQSFVSENEQIDLKPGDVQAIESVLKRTQSYEENILADVLELTKVINLVNIFSLLEAEFAMDICAMFHLLMVFEAVNVHEDNRPNMQRAIKMESDFQLKYGKFFESFERTNEDKSVCYRRVNEHLEMVLSEYADKNYDITKCVVGFLDELQKKKEKQVATHYNSFLCLLALPVYKSLGGYKNLKVDV